VQECTVPGNLVFYCGKSRISRSLLRRALSSIWGHHGTKGTLKYDAQWNRSRILEWYKQACGPNTLQISLVATLAYLGDHHSTDPRDRIYSLGGLVDDFALAGTPDYVQSVETLYTNLVRSFVENYRNLDIICFATNFSHDASECESDTGLPSWVPDWRVSAVPLVGPLMVSQSAGIHIGNFRPLHSLNYSVSYSASLDMKPCVSFSTDLQSIECEGVLLDRIDGLTGLPDQNSSRYPRESDILEQSTSCFNILSDKSSNANSPDCISSDVSYTTKDASDIFKSIMRCLVLNREDHYFNNAAPERRFMEEFTTCLAGAIVDAPDLDVCLAGWFNENRLFHINGIDLQSLFQKYLKGEKPGTQEMPDKTARHNFISRFHDTIVKMARRLVISESGLLGMAPRRARKGDLICILYGCSVPVVLRPHVEKGGYSFIGECYVDGFMNGEALASPRYSKKRIFEIT
jgi:hypothetical protein